MNKTTCWTCGTAYEGYSCPICEQRKMLKEHAEEMERISAEETRRRTEESQAMQDAIQEAALEMEMAAYEAAERQKRNISSAWQLQAQSKSDRAHELYDAGMYAEAVRLSKEAIKQDPSNIEPYICAAWSLEKEGRQAEAADYYKKQIGLLDTQRYRQSPDTFDWVLSGLPADDDALDSAFSDSLRRNSAGWSRAAACFGLLDTLLQFEFVDEARHVAEALAGRSDSLLLQAYLLEIEGHAGAASTVRLSSYLRSIPFNLRAQVLDNFQSIANREEPFSETTMNLLREGICERYNEWRPDIENDISEYAIREAKGAKQGWGGRLGIFCFIIFAGVLPTLLQGIANVHERRIRANMSVLAFGALFTSIGFGYWGGYISKRIMRAKYAGQRIGPVEEQENQTWHNVCSSPINVRRPSVPSSITAEVVVLAAVTLGIFVGIFSYMSS